MPFCCATIRCTRQSEGRESRHHEAFYLGAASMTWPQNSGGQDIASRPSACWLACIDLKVCSLALFRRLIALRDRLVESSQMVPSDFFKCNAFSDYMSPPSVCGTLTWAGAKTGENRDSTKDYGFTRIANICIIGPPRPARASTHHARQPRLRADSSRDGNPLLPVPPRLRHICRMATHQHASIDTTTHHGDDAGEGMQLVLRDAA